MIDGEIPKKHQGKTIQADRLEARVRRAFSRRRRVVKRRMGNCRKEPAGAHLRVERRFWVLHAGE
jgi:hypothetical protein